MLRHRRLSTAVALGVTAVAASLATVAPSHADNPCTGTASPSVHVSVVGDIHASQTFSALEICQSIDVTLPIYEIRYTTAGDATTFHDNPSAVVSIQKLVTSVRVGSDATLPLDTVTFVQIIGSQRSAALDQQQVRDPSVFQNSLAPGVWYLDGSATTTYFRNVMGPGDVNATDLVANTDQPLQVTVHTSGSLLHPSITASPTTIDAGQRVSFAVTFADPQPTTHLRYHWSFGDGRTSSAAAPSHRFTASCSCLVRLDVTGSDTSTGSSFTSVQVGPPPTQSTGPTSGPTSTGGTHENGPTDGPTTAGPTSSAGPASRPSAQPTSGPTDGAAAPTSVPSRSDGPGTSSGTEVAGRLLLASQVYAVPQEPPPATQAASARAPIRLSRSWRWAGFLVLPLLVGLGMAKESLQLRRRLARMGP